MKLLARIAVALSIASCSWAQSAPYDKVPEAKPPYYRVRYDASQKEGELAFAVQYTVWIPEGVKELRGVVVHQHGCGEGSCRSGITGAFDLHWQALARAHDCALLSPVYEQPQEANCQLWCDPRNGSSATFQRGLVELGGATGHPELAEVPWALWGHSGGGHWCGGMVLLHPERVVAAWLRSGVPTFEPIPERDDIKPYDLPDAALHVPMMCNLGTKEGVTDKSTRFARVWPANLAFFAAVRGKGGLLGVAVDPLTSHECGNQRYLAIRWLHECLMRRLPIKHGEPLRAMPIDDAWLAQPGGSEAAAASEFTGDMRKAAWLPTESFAKRWDEYVTDTNVTDSTPPPPPTDVQATGNRITWQATADLESGLSHFIIQRDGEFLARVPEVSMNRFGRDIFQGLQYSDTPARPLARMEYTDETTGSKAQKSYGVIAVNTVGKRSEPTAVVVASQVRPRLAVLTDIGGDPDDQQSLVRLMVYSNEFEIEALIASASGTPGELKEAVTRPDLILEIVDAYAEVLPNLQRHASGWPAADTLRKRVKSGNPNRGRTFIGAGHDTKGSRELIRLVDAGTEKWPLNLAIWGGQTDLAQALFRVKQRRGASGLEAFASKLRVYDIADQDGLANWIRSEFPGLFYILNKAPDGLDKRRAVFRGMYLTGDETLTSRDWVEEHVRSKGPLGVLYPTKTWTAPNEFACLKEGDTPSWFFFLPLGGNDPRDPTKSGWGGSFRKGEDGWFYDVAISGDFDPRTTVSKFRPEFQAGFAERMRWCVK